MTTSDAAIRERPKALRRLVVPAIDIERICAEARARADRIAAGASDAEVADAWRAEHPELDPGPEHMPIVRAWFRDHHAYRIARELAMDAEAQRDRALAAAAREAVAAAYGLDVAELTGAKARELLDDAWDHARELGRNELRYQRDPAAQRRARAAATRAETQHRRLEDHLRAAGLVSDDDDGGLAYAGEATP
jgi:hypothetical protein